MKTIFTILLSFFFSALSLFAQKSVTITGKVESVETMRDGYTAKIVTTKNKIYYATVRQSNLEAADEYRVLTKGESIKLKGEGGTSAGKNTLAVRKIYSTTVAGDKQPNFAAQGIVKEVSKGVDGYTAKIFTADKKVYFVIVSPANLTNAQEYREVNVGETMDVVGDFWVLNKENRITARKLK